MMLNMRTTINIESDTLNKIRQIVRKEKQTLTEIINALLKKALSSKLLEDGTKKKFIVEAFDLSLREGIDHLKFNQLATELENEEIENKLKRSK